MIRIACLRTKMEGRTEESILRRSRGRREYFAINSLFLNSPLTSVTLPCSSNSVQRSRNSLLGLMILPPSPAFESSKKLPCAGSSSLWYLRLLVCFWGRNLLQNGFFRLDEVDRERVSSDLRTVVNARVHCLLKHCGLHLRSDTAVCCVRSCDRRNFSNVGDGAVRP